ncbi:MAG: hypothetical protein Q8P00_03045 [Dehalococcoidia bacterium]|nr:hypothetical protein [Dehalococcoidia bacterium]
MRLYVVDIPECWLLGIYWDFGDSAAGCHCFGLALGPWAVELRIRTGKGGG